MRLTGKQKTALRNVLSFTASEFIPSDVAIEWFFGRSDKGLKIKYEDSKDFNDYTDLLLAHHLMSGLQEEIWLESHCNGDFPLGVLIYCYIKDIGTDESLYKRKAPAFRRALKLWMETCREHYDR